MTDKSADEGQVDTKRGSRTKKAGRVITTSLGWDVLYRDARRIKPRFPNLWKDIWSVTRWGSRSAEVADDIKKPSDQLPRATLSALLSILFTVFFVAYWALVVSASTNASNNVYGHLVMGLLCLAAFYQSCAYSYIVVLLRRRDARAAKEYKGAIK